MAKKAIIKDTDLPLKITLKDSAGLPVDLNNLAGIIVKVFQDHIVFDQFSLNVQAGFETLTITDAVNGMFEIYLNADRMIKGRIDCPVFYEVKTQAVNVNFESGTEEKSCGKKLIGILKQTELKNTTFL